MKFMIGLLAALFLTFAHAQVPVTGAGKGTPTVAATYQGPGDLSLSVTTLAWNGVRCYTKTYAGSVADITDSATGNTTGTRLKCDGAGNVVDTVSGSACTFVTGNVCSALTTTCATACNVRILYDQSGLTNCTATACDMLQATNANRPAFIRNTQNGYGAIRCSGTAQQLQTTNVIATINNPWSVSVVAGKRTSVTYQSIYMGDTSLGFLYNNTNANQVLPYQGTTGAGISATDNAYHSFEVVLNGSSSSVLVDTTPNTGITTGGTVWSGGKHPNFGNFAGIACGMDWFEGGLYSGGFTSGDQNALEANQHGTSGYNF